MASGRCLAIAFSLDFSSKLPVFLLSIIEHNNNNNKNKLTLTENCAWKKQKHCTFTDLMHTERVGSPFSKVNPKCTKLSYADEIEIYITMEL